jgi:hypothetical protein
VAAIPIRKLRVTLWLPSTCLCSACIEIFGGPQRAEVSGTLNGGTIEATFNRRNGCEIERWDAVGALLPSGG